MDIKILIVRGLKSINVAIIRNVKMVISMEVDGKFKFGLQIRRIRQRLGYSQEKLALICEMDRSYIGGIGRGERNVSLNNILKIASALGVHPACLFQEYVERLDNDKRG